MVSDRLIGTIVVSVDVWVIHVVVLLVAAQVGLFGERMGGDPIDDHVNLFPAGSSYGMRPVVVVKADASLLGGRGEDSDPWLFGI